MYFNVRRKGCLYNLHHLKEALESAWKFGEILPSSVPEDVTWGDVIKGHPLKPLKRLPELSVRTVWIQPGPEVPFSDASWWVDTPRDRVPRTYAARKVA